MYINIFRRSSPLMISIMIMIHIYFDRLEIIGDLILLYILLIINILSLITEIIIYTTY
jgi:hypothetical protein